MTIRLAVATLVLTLAGVASARVPKPSFCHDGRFVKPPGGPSLVAGAVVTTPEALVLAAPTISIPGRCPAVKVRLRPTRKGLTVIAAWPRNTCGPTRVRLRATIDARCEVMRGVLRAARAVPVPFAAPRCGDASIDAADGEECDAGGCDANEQCSEDCRCVARAPTVSFGAEVQPIFNARCALPACHTGAFPTQGLDLSAGRSYAAIVGRRSTERSDLNLVDPRATATSYLAWKISGAPAGQTILGSPMPLTGGPLSPAEQATIRTWIEQGAVNDQAVTTTSTTTVTTTVVTVTTTVTVPESSTTTTSTTTVTVPESSTTTTSTTTVTVPDLTTTTTAPAGVSFETDVQPIFTARCALPACHSGPFPTQGLNLSDGSAYADIVNVMSTERPDLKLIDPGSTSMSYLWWKAGEAPPGQMIMGAPMPFLQAPLSPEQMATIRDWITEGAPNN